MPKYSHAHCERSLLYFQFFSSKIQTIKLKSLLVWLFEIWWIFETMVEPYRNKVSYFGKWEILLHDRYTDSVLYEMILRLVFKDIKRIWSNVKMWKIIWNNQNRVIFSLRLFTFLFSFVWLFYFYFLCFSLPFLLTNRKMFGKKFSESKKTKWTHKKLQEKQSERNIGRDRVRER